MSEIKVLMLSWEYPPHSVGGLARHVEELSEALAEKDVDVHVLTMGSASIPKLETRNGVTLHRVEPYGLQALNFATWVQQLNFRMVEEAVKILQTETFDLVHAHDWLVAYAGRVIKHAYRLPLVATVHATEAGRNQGLHNEEQQYINNIEWWLTYEAWKVIVCSQHMHYEVRRLFGLPEDKVKIIPNGVDQRKFKQSGKQNISFGEGKIIFFVGRLVREKGVQVLLEAAPQILRVEPRAKFFIAGMGPMEEQLRQQARALGLGERVQFLGYIDDQTRNQIYQQAKLAVFPSLYEPFGIVALEAMAAEIPVVVSDVGGMGQIVTHGVNGLKALPGNVQSLANSILQALQNEGLCQELKLNGKRLIDQVYSWQKIAEQTEKVYKEVLAEYAKSPWSKEGNIPRANGETTDAERYSLVAQRANFFTRSERRN